ncbi:MAG: FAD-dependent oxidoreductase [Polyangiaceae bacterium]
MKRTFDVVVVGGGLSGLAAATYLGRAGLAVAVVEKASELGGRARTTVESGYSLNLGAHAVYRNSHAFSVLKELEVPLTGSIPSGSGAVAITKDGTHAMPVGLVSMLTTGLLSFAGKLELSRVLASLGGIDPAPLAGERASDWIERTVKTEGARGMLRALARVATYTGDLEGLSAGAAVSQMQLALKHNVLYLDHGWQTMVEALRDRASAAGAVIFTGDGVKQVEPARDGGAVRVELAEGRAFEASAVLLAVGPRAAASLVPSSASLSAIAERARPVKAATLDVALSSLPVARTRFALGTDRALYFSVHSAVARLAPEGGAVVHAMMYDPRGEAHAVERELEDMLDRVQPGWRERVVHRRFLPSMVAANDLVAAARGGYAGRPGVVVGDAAGVFVAGDWVGDDGMLLDAALASARGACTAIQARVRSTGERRARSAAGATSANGAAGGVGAAAGAGAARGRSVQP